METRTVIDQVGRTVLIPKFPQRIVSLVPSQTELLCDLGLKERVVGITKFCVHPKEWFRTKARIGGTKKLDFNAISDLNPDLIIANKEENNKEDIERLAKDFPVWVSDVNDLDSAVEMIQLVGKITQTNAFKLATEIETEFQELKPIYPKKKTLYLIWKNPYMSAGSDTFIHDIMKRCGFENAISDSRYPQLSEQNIVALKPELVLLSSEPFPFKAKHIEELQGLLPNAEIKLVNGEMFSWYGSRLKHVPPYLSTIFHYTSRDLSQRNVQR